jgi:outer membrane protein, heavy metal efflux system
LIISEEPMAHYFAGFGLVAALLALPSAASALDCEVVSRANIVACALSPSVDVRVEREGLQVLEGRRTAASTLLPSNPSLAFSVGQPAGYALSASNLTWSAALAQEVEIGGQRGDRLAVVAAQRTAQERRTLAKAREVARDALTAYFDALAAAEEMTLAKRLARLAESLTEYAIARAESGLLAPVDADVAAAEAIRLAQIEINAELRLANARATLTSLLGRDASLPVQVAGDLEPLTVVDATVQQLTASAVSERVDISVALAEQHAESRRVELLRTLRIPNPTFSVFVRRDWIGERVAGVGLSFPIPLPSPLGRTNAGEIDEARAAAHRAGSQVEVLRRRVRLEVVEARHLLAARRRERALFTDDRVRRAEQSISAIGEELRAQKMPVREALLLEQSLVELVLQSIEARRQLCLASVELARAAGLPIERGVK